MLFFILKASFHGYITMWSRFIIIISMFALKNAGRVNARRAAFVEQCTVRRAFSVMSRRAIGSRPVSSLSQQRIEEMRYHRQSTVFSSFSTARKLSSQDDDDSFFAKDPDFASLGIQSEVLLRRLGDMGITRPTAVQSAAYTSIRKSQNDTTIGAETGSGKVRKKRNNDKRFLRVTFPHCLLPSTITIRH